MLRAHSLYTYSPEPIDSNISIRRVKVRRRDKDGYSARTFIISYYYFH